MLLGNKVQKIEEGYKEFFTLNQFRLEAESLETKLLAEIQDKFGTFFARLTALEAKQDVAAANCSKK